ncbi:MAG: hypothetical protein RBR86_02635 [Pseudobdellovibrionaceae bacterium]|jgi:hypothetical protein|nr:hypothetical protein [Pseudobdellovibrionaceae bacterium]
MIDKDTQNLKFPWAAFVPVNDVGDAGGDRANVAAKPVGIQYIAARKGIYIRVGAQKVELSVYEADTHGPLPSGVKGSKVKRFQLLCPECLQAPLTQVSQSRSSGSFDVGEHFRTVSNPHQLPHSPTCAMRVLDLSNQFLEVSDHVVTPIDPLKSPVVFINIKKKLLGDIEVVHKGRSRAPFRRSSKPVVLNDEAKEVNRIVLYHKSGEKEAFYDEILKGRERYAGKKIDDVILASSVIPSDLLDKTSFIYEGRATPWSLFHVGAVAGHKSVRRGGEIDPFAKMIKYIYQNVHYPVLCHFELDANRGRQMSEDRVRFALPSVTLDIHDESGKLFKKKSVVPLIHVRDADVVKTLNEGGLFSVISVPYINIGADGRIFLNLEIKGADVVSRLGAKAFAQKLAVTEKHDPRITGVVQTEAAGGTSDTHLDMYTVQMGLKGIADDSFGPDATKQSCKKHPKPALSAECDVSAQGKQPGFDFQ